MAAALSLIISSDLIPAAAAPAPAQANDPRAEVDQWLPGDVHVHAAGDSGLGSHLRCQLEKGLDEAGCAQYLVDATLERAEVDEINWLIYTEHIPWLGIRPTTVDICQTIGIRPVAKTVCKSVPAPSYDAAQAKRQYDAIRDAVRRAGRSEVHALMGQEMGTAGHVTTATNFLRRNAAPVFDKLDREVGPITCPGYKSGHYAVYSAADMIPDSIYACDEDRYLDDARSASAWGAVNHPDNDDGGSPWYCWNDGDGREWDTTVPSPRDEAEKRLPGVGEQSDPPGCRTSVVGTPDPVRAVELVNDRNMPSAKALRELDTMLLQGRRLGVVGGGDSHTSRPDGDTTKTIDVFGREIPVLNVGISRQLPGNDGKLGLVGRTWLPLRAESLPDEVDPTAPDDPVRRAISEGRTVATTGPLGLPSVRGSYPGDDARFAGSSVELRVDFKGARVANDDGVVSLEDWPDYGRDQMLARTSPSPLPTHLVVVVGLSNVCRAEPDATDSTSCAAEPNLRRLHYDITPEQARDESMTVQVPVPAELTAGYLRTEVYFGDQQPKGNDRYIDGHEWRHGAFSSPIWLVRDPFLVPTTALDEPCAHADYPAPIGADGRVSCLSAIEADLDGNTKPDRLFTWRRTADDSVPPFGRDAANGAVAFLDDGSYHFLEEATSSWAEPAQVLYPHAVTDLNGDGRAEVLLTSLVGTNTLHYAVLTLTANRRLHAARFEDGQVHYLTSGGGAGYGSGYGCVLSEGERLAVDAGHVTIANASTSGQAYSWFLRLYRLYEGSLAPVAGSGGLHRDGASYEFTRAQGANDCTGDFPEIGRVPAGAQTAADAVTALLAAAVTRDEQTGRNFVSGAPFPPHSPMDSWDALAGRSGLDADRSVTPQCQSIPDGPDLPSPPYQTRGRSLCQMIAGVSTLSALVSYGPDNNWRVDAIVVE